MIGGETESPRYGQNMKYITRDSEAGNEIERFNSREEAERAIESYEEEDKKNEEYTDGFYEIIERAE